MLHPRVPRRRTALLLALSLLALAPLAKPLHAQARKPTLTPADYGKWESLGYGTLSPEGRWLAASIRKVDGDEELRIRKVGTDSVVVVEHGTTATFSGDERWAAYTIGVSEKTRERLEKEKKPVREAMGLLNLVDGDTVLVPEVSRYAFSGDGRFLAFERYASNGGGADLLVRNLSTGMDTHFGSVTDFSWSDVGARLAFVVAGHEGVGAGVQLYLPGPGTLRPLASGAPKYAGLAWRKKADDLAALAAEKDSGWVDTTHIVLAWRDVSREGGPPDAFNPILRNDFPDSTRVVETRDPRWSDDGARIFFGIKEREAKPASKKKGEKGDSAAADSARADSTRTDSTAAAAGDHDADADTLKPGLEIWHAKDVDVIPAQKVSARRDERRSDLAAWTLKGDHFARLTNGPGRRRHARCAWRHRGGHGQ